MSKPINKFEDLKMSIDSNFYTFEESMNETQIKVNEMYKIGPNSVDRTWNIWNAESGFLFKENDQLERRSDFEGVEIKAASLENGPFVYTYNNSDSNQIRIEGFFADIWKSFEAHFNFTTQFWNSLDGLWGSKGPNGSWNGILGMIERNLVDVAVADMSMKRSRMEDFDYTDVVHTTPDRLYIPTPGLEHDWTTFLQPFSTDMWIAILITILLVSFLWKIMHLNPDNHVPFSELVLSIFSLLFQQGSAYEPQRVPHRIVLFVFALFGLIIYTAFAAELTSLFSVKKYDLPFENLDELLHKSDYKIGSLKSTSFDEIFQVSTYHL